MSIIHRVPEEWLALQSQTTVKIKKLHPDAVIPEYKTSGAVGFDLVAIQDVVLQPPTTASHGVQYNQGKMYFKPETVGTGLAFEIPPGYELEIRSRSGLAFKHKVYAYNGTIDSDYRAEVKIQLTNMGDSGFRIEAGDRIAQGIIKPIETVNFVVVDELSSTERGNGGFGSTGVKS